MKKKKENVRLRLGGKPTSVHGDCVQVSGIPLGGAAGDPLLEGEPGAFGVGEGRAEVLSCLTLALLP